MRDTLGRLELRIVDLLTMRASGEAANRDVFVPGGAMGWIEGGGFSEEAQAIQCTELKLKLHALFL
jgi:hypothetical protein